MSEWSRRKHMSGKKYSSNHHVLYYECDKTQRMTMQMLLNLLIQVSGEQSNELGLTEEKMTEMGVAWIVLQHMFTVTRMPVTNEVITVETSAKQYNKFFCYRDFIVTNQAGETLVALTMVFAVLDIEKRKMTHISDEMVARYEAPLVKRPIRTPRPLLIDEEIVDSSTYRVRYFDIDANNHVNNSKYVEWMFDMLGADFLSQHEVKSGTIKFEKEVLYGSPVECQASFAETSDSIQTAHRIQSEGNVNCTASFEWSNVY